MRDALPAFLAHLADRRSPRTVRAYGAIFESFADFVNADTGAPSAPPPRASIENFLARPRRDGARRAPATRNQELAALRAFTNFAMRDLGWTTNPTLGIPFAREAPRDPAVLSTIELRQIFLVAANTAPSSLRSRNLALIAVLSQTGLRVHELVGLDGAQVDLASGTLAAVKGKGGTVHDMPLNAPAIALVTAWLAERSEHAHEDEPALFVSSRGTRLSIRSVEHIVFGLRESMGSAKKITPHTLRHTAATIALTQGTDLATVAELLRQSDLNTTRRYLHLVDTRRREAVARLAVTVPAEVLPAPSAPPVPSEPFSKPPLAEIPLGRIAPGPIRLDGQYGLLAMSPPERVGPAGSIAPNTTRTRSGACRVFKEVSRRRCTTACPRVSCEPAKTCSTVRCDG